ncbi:protein mono-ADP-ribosyltransferase PARP10 isoform X2 [Melanotaenia boesemani]|nr:protein mono-ADP-ribosyltransferase PARP10 isoform X2 [Melanotaenia boesemani]
MSVGSPEERTVEVLALPEGIDEELLCLYFENKKRSGGGSIESVGKRGNHVVLVFEEAEAAARVLSKGHHVLHNIELIVRKPPSKDPCRLLLRGINPGTSLEMIELYVENMMDLNMTDYTLHPSPGSDFVLIHFCQPFSKDFQTLSAKISKRKLVGAEVTLEQIEQTDSVLVENLHPGTTTDLLSLYFESARGGNQTVKEVTMLSEGAAKVSFANYESVDPVLNLQHKLDDTELVVKPYYNFLQPTPSQDVEIESQEVTETSSEDLNVIQQQTGPILADADQPSPAEPSDSSHSSSSQTALDSPAAGETVEMVEEEVMEDETDEAQTLTCDLAITDPVKYSLFQCSSVYEDIQKTNPDFSIQIKDDCVHIAGPNRLQVEQIKHTIMDFIGNMVTVHFTLELEQAQLLARKDVEEQLLKAMHQPDSPASYSVLDTNVMVTSVSQSAADQACSFLKSQVSHLSITVDTELECMLYCREWNHFLQTLGFTCVKVSERGGNIDVLTLKGMENDKRTAILEFLSTPIESESVISMDPNMLKYIQIHCHQLLADMDQVSIVPLEAEDSSGLKIHGHAVACQMAEEVLQGVVSSICTRTITVNAPGVTRFLDEKECRSIMNEMETKFQVYISPEYVPWKPLQHQDVFETAWKMMSHKNFQIVSTNDSTPELKSNPLPMDLNGVSNKGLLEEAKRIVSAIDKSQEEEVAAADQLVDVDHMDLYMADEPGSLTVLDSDTTAAETSQPLADQNAASGPLLMTDGVLAFASNLEEEAQLSLAIQFSMESSQWTLADEEEQLQKALELSKKMTHNESGSSATNKSPQVDLQEKKNVHISLQDAIKAANTIHLHVFAGYSCDLIRVDIAFNKKVSQRQVEEKLEHRNVGNISDYHRKCLEVIMWKHAVRIELEGTIIAVSGFKDYVAEAMCDVKLLMDKICNAVTDKEILKTVQWERHLTSSDSTPYSPDATVFLENSWRMKLKKVDILLDNQPHIIDFEKMTECNVASEKSVKISRKLLELADLTGDVPVEEYSLLSNMPEATKVDEESDEFQSVVRTFYETIHEYHSKIRIIQVEKLMNRLLYNQYKLKKASILQRSSHPAVERTLYHGTSQESVKEICVHGFNRSFCGKNATVYGQGVYFAVNSCLSVKSQYSPPNADGYKFIFVSKVLTGDFTKGDHSMKTAPLKETGDVPLRYDSVTDDITKPTMFVIFNDTQAFPEYLITCQQIHR